MSCELTVLRESTLNSVPGDDSFRAWADAAMDNASVSLAIRVVDEAASHELNERYRRQAKPTNVLSFPAEIPAAVAEQIDYPPLGDLVICAPLVRTEALAQDKPEAHHWAHLTVHGVLHLCGYDHAEDKQAELMEQLEIEVLDRLGIPNPYTVKI